jgi:PIN domain nuclease of toxin-antitoxin system
LTSILLDTHAWAWAVTEPSRLPEKTQALMSAASSVRVSSVSFFEIAQKVRIGKWPEMAMLLDQLESVLLDRGGFVAPVTGAIGTYAARMNWSHRDPFDRMIAATALSGGDVLISADATFDTLPLRRVW